MSGPKDLRALSYQILLQAKRSRPSVDFLYDVCRLLNEFFSCDAIELWLVDKGRCARWEITRSPVRFYRLADLEEDSLHRAVQAHTLGRLPAKPIPAAPGHELGRHAHVSRHPLAMGDETIGLMILKDDDPAVFQDISDDLYQDVAQTVAVAVAHQRVQLAQRERVKELSCLYEIARVASQPGRDLEDVLRRIVAFLPPSWQYPEVTGARLVLDGITFATDGFDQLRHSQRADIIIGGQPRGEVEVAYREERPDLDEGPFLHEERRLLDTVAREVASIVERKSAEAERVRMQNQLRQADRLATIGQLAAGVAHELNEPLGGILGFAQLAKRHPELPEQAARDLGKIEAASLHAREVVRKLMLFARQAPSKQALLSLNEVIEEGLFFLETRCAKEGIELERELSPDLPPLELDRGQLHQVLINLVVNGLQAMPDGGRLQVVSSLEGEHVVLAVHDEGQGIPAEVMDRIFDPFYTTKDVGEGTGLGLPVVHGIVAAHGGRIDVRSAPGTGSSFLVRLPVPSQEDGENNRSER